MGKNSHKVAGSTRRCDICECLVPDGDQAWQTHTAGIRHRRNAASCKVYGEPGHLVVSAFEHVDVPASSNYVGKDNVLLATKHQQAATPAAGSQSAAAAGGVNRRQVAVGPGSKHALLQQLQRQVTKQLAYQVGVNTLYSSALERFTLPALEAAHDKVTECIGHLNHIDGHIRQDAQQAQQCRQEQRQQHKQQQPAALAPQPQCFWQQARELQKFWTFDVNRPAEALLVAGMLPPWVVQLKLTVPYQTYGAAAAATSAAIASFCELLPRHQQLTQIELDFSAADYSRICGQGGVGLARLPELWSHVVKALTAAVRVHCGLQQLLLRAFPGQFPADDIAQLQGCLITSRKELRQTLLLAITPRVGASSPLHKLPREVLGQLLDMAVPRQPCKLLLDLPQGLAGNSSSVDSSNNDHDSSSSSGDDSSSSSSYGDIGSGGDDDSSSIGTGSDNE